MLTLTSIQLIHLLQLLAISSVLCAITLLALLLVYIFVPAYRDAIREELKEPLF